MAENNDQKILNANKAAREAALQSIYMGYRKSEEDICLSSARHELYDALSFLCRRKSQSLIGYGDLLISAGENFNIMDAAKLSHFPVREIELEHEWYKKDAGDFIGWMRDEDGEEHPVACVIGKTGQYHYYMPGRSNSLKNVTPEAAARMLPQAYEIYRTFGKEAVGWGGFFRFCLSCLRLSDVGFFLLLFAVGTAIGLLVPALTSTIYDRFISGGEPYYLAQVIALLLAANLAGILIEVIKNFAYLRISGRITYIVQEAVFERVIYLPAKLLRSESSADMAKRVLDVSAIFQIVFNVLISAVMTAVFSIAYLVMMAGESQSLTNAGLLMTLGLIVILLPTTIHLRRQSVEKMKLDADLAAVSWQMVEGIEKIKDTGAEDRAMNEYLQSYIVSNGRGVRIQSGVLWVTVVTGAYNVLSSIVFYALAGSSINTISVGNFMAFMASYAIFSMAMTGLLQAISNSSSLGPAFDRLKLILQTPPDYSRNGALLRSLDGNVDVDGVTFAYDSSHENVLKNISLHVKKGEYIGIAGASGCGKSTLFRLLLGLEEPKEGDIYYDGHSLKSLDRQNLFSKMGIVLQNGQAFTGSIRENITFIHPEATQAQVNAIVKAVGLESDIRKMPMGLDTFISDGGGVLSGGQQQRILLARAMVTDPAIIYLDEATSALDNMTQNIVCETLSRMKATKIVIAHRLSTLTACDRILVMEDGRFVEEGTYQELLDKKGKFYELAERQLI